MLVLGSENVIVTFSELDILFIYFIIISFTQVKVSKPF